ncbi:hypothetical protein H7F30_14085 [Dermacoccus sp. PAMC28757]|nr:hypothetical protein [Dermacoccus sp. PAMC28757]QNK52671.1 hypothetical protein H7F30_14085 [Dermacoccus sp. PAMC28757]
MKTMEQDRVERFERTFYERDIDSTYLDLYRREQVLPRADVTPTLVSTMT